jgi:hypothetical protein
MIRIKHKKTAVVISVTAMFLFVGSAYAFVKTQIKPTRPLIKEASAKKVDETAPLKQQVAVADNAPAEVSQAAAVNVVPAVVTQATVASQYLVHQNISTTYFWVGEEADADNKNISNSPSAWDEQWAQHFGGVDDPNKRNGYVVAKFTPKENSFYFALPYNDFDGDGNRKKDVNSVIPWASSKKWGATESIVKNQWIKITKGGKTAYAQWEDVGPFKEDDQAYVFGTATPKSKTNDNAGLDVSPAVKDFLGLGDVDKTSWQFIDASQVPDGPWKSTTTNSQISWS